MKNPIFFLLVLLILTIAVNCGDKKSNPASYVDDYEPDYNEATGTSYSGNFFPVEEGDEWHYTGSMYGYSKMKFSGTYYGQKINETEEDSLDYPYCVGLSRILSPITANLSDGIYTLYPEEGYSDLGMEYAESEIIRYYEVTDSIVYIRAIPGEMELLEVEDPVFVKSQLVVGDSWESNPTMNTSSFVGEDESIEIHAKCKLFVVGMASVSLFLDGRLQQFQAMQVDEVAEFTGTMQSMDFGSTAMDISGKILLHLFLVKDIGIIVNQQYLEMAMDGKISDSNGTININMDFWVDADLSLSSYNDMVSTRQSSHNIPAPKLFKTDFPFNVQRIYQNVNRIVELLSP